MAASGAKPAAGAGVGFHIGKTAGLRLNNAGHMHGASFFRAPGSIGLIASLAILFPALLPGEQPAHDFARWEKEISAFEASDRTNPPPQNGVLFIGSSTIRLWKTLASDFPGTPVINRGFGGSQIVDS